MSKNQLESRAKVLWNNPDVSEEINLHNQTQWVQAVLALGSKWLYAIQVQRLTKVGV